MADQVSDDLAVLEPPSSTASLRGEKVEVRPLEIRQIPPFARAIRFAAPSLARTYASAGLDDGSFEASVLDLIAEHGEMLIAACAIAIDREAEWLAKAPPDEFITLLKAIVQVNADFFASRVAPMLAQARAQAAAAAASASDGAGSTQSTT